AAGPLELCPGHRPHLLARCQFGDAPPGCLPYSPCLLARLLPDRRRRVAAVGTGVAVVVPRPPARRGACRTARPIASPDAGLAAVPPHAAGDHHRFLLWLDLVGLPQLAA